MWSRRRAFWQRGARVAPQDITCVAARSRRVSPVLDALSTLPCCEGAKCAASSPLTEPQLCTATATPLPGTTLARAERLDSAPSCPRTARKPCSRPATGAVSCRAAPVPAASLRLQAPKHARGRRQERQAPSSSSTVRPTREAEGLTVTNPGLDWRRYMVKEVE